MTKIAYCQMTRLKDFEETIECIKRVSPFVDYTIIVYEQTLQNDKTAIDWLAENKNKYNIHDVYSEWKDSFPIQRNVYLKAAKELEMDWIAVSDPDELFNEELAKDLKGLVEKYETEEYTVLGVNVKDQFENFDWLDDLDKIKEIPYGYRETDYYKPLLILKISGINSGIEYAGVGVTKNVHETMVGGRLRQINLDKKYFYVHKKSALKIWNNAARNMWISGGGDNVGETNPLWVKLRGICNRLGIDSWNVFEMFIEEGIDKYLREKEIEIRNSYYGDTVINDDAADEIIKTKKIEEIRCEMQKFESWLISALQAGTNKWQTETRETAKWYYALHRDEIDDFILDYIENPPVIPPKTELENFVDRTYYEVLGRGADIDGKLEHVKLIEEGKLKKEDLSGKLRNSKEYRDKFPFERRTTIATVVDYTVNLPKIEATVSDINTNINTDNESEIIQFVENAYQKILLREPGDTDPAKQNYAIKIKSKLLSPMKFIEIIENSAEYRDKHITYKVAANASPFKEAKDRQLMRKPTTHEEILDLESIDTSKYNTVALCIMGHKDVMNNILLSIERIGKVCDEIHIQGDNFTSENIIILNEAGKKIGKDIDIHIVPWKEDFADYKNKAIGWAKTEWVTIWDDDEIPSEKLASKLKDIILKSDRGNNFDLVTLDVVDVILNNEGNVKHRSDLNKGKANLHWNVPNPYYGDVHIWLRPGYYNWKSTYAKGYYYEHWKDENKILRCSARNVFLGGGGDAVKEKNEEWIELRNVCKDLGINDWKSFNEYLIKGNIDNRVSGVIFRLADKKWKDDELKDVLKYYWSLHPAMLGYGHKEV